MKRFRKRPVEIEAALLTMDTLDRVYRWIGANGGGVTLEMPVNEIPYLVIHTLEGDMEARLGDWVIKGVEGEFYPCRASVFEQTYEEVES